MAQFIIDRLYEQDIKDLVLSHGSILLTLARYDDLNLQEIAEKVNKSPQTITTLVRKLVKEDYVILKKSNSDKREKVVTLSEKGREFMPIMNVISDELFEVQFKGMSIPEQEALRSLLQRMLNNFDSTDVVIK